MLDTSFYAGKKVFLTGHTGFKGAWMSRLLINIGAELSGYSLEPPTMPALFSLMELEKEMNSFLGDVRDLSALKKAFDATQPEIVIHMAAQSKVREGYTAPVHTYETNVIGTLNVLECVRTFECVRSFLNVTTDKVYENKEWLWGYRENESLDGYDPYSNSKSCSELITHCYQRSFFANSETAISTARAGNVIGGGDFANERIIPDCVRSVMSNTPLVVRNPHSIRPYQHVLEPICAYLMIAAEQFKNGAHSDCYNIGPDDVDCITTGQLASMFCKAWGPSACWEHQQENGPHEAAYLKLDSSKLKNTFGWKPKWHIDAAVEKTCEWTKTWLSKGDVIEVMDKQMMEYLGDAV
jgi:CDP-glucose 4,6-dehydratase